MFASLTDAYGAIQHQSAASVQGQQLHVADLLRSLRHDALRTVPTGAQMSRSVGQVKEAVCLRYGINYLFRW